MHELSFERQLRADPARVLKRVEKWLLANGYEVAARSGSELSLLGAGLGGRHRLTVRADGQRVSFVFAEGAPGIALPESAELERRVEGALSELGPAPAGGGPDASAGTGSTRRCSLCATSMDASATTCPTCGMAQ